MQKSIPAMPAFGGHGTFFLAAETLAASTTWWHFDAILTGAS
jgi:hypothetical protein